MWLFFIIEYLGELKPALLVRRIRRGEEGGLKIKLRLSTKFLSKAP